MSPDKQTTQQQSARDLIDAIVERHKRTGLIFDAAVMSALVALLAYTTALEARLAVVESGEASTVL